MSEKHPDWRLQGRYFETCNCASACPCVWLQSPTEGDCKLLVAWHIDSGYLEGTRLDGLNVALACHAPGHMMQGDWRAALYIDQAADDTQTEALIQLFSGQASGHLSVLMGFVGTVWGIKRVEIDYQEQDDTRRLLIPGIAAAEIQSIQGIRGGEALIGNPPLCVVASHPAVVAKSRHYHYQDYGQTWEFSERNGYHSAFEYRP